MPDCVIIHVPPAVAAAVSVESLTREIVMPGDYSILSTEQGASRKNSLAIPLVQVTVTLDGPAVLEEDWSGPDLQSAVSAAASCAYRRTLPSSAETPIYIKHPHGYSICSGGLDGLHKTGLPEAFADQIYGSGVRTATDLNAHLWFHEGIGAGVVARSEPTGRDWEDIRKSLEAATSAMSRIQRKRAERG